MAKPASGSTLNTGHALYTSLAAVWGMLEGSGTTSADSTGNGHTLTFAGGGGAPTWSTDGSGDAVIAIGTALNQPLAVGTPFSLSGSSPWSIAFRFKQTADDDAGMVLGDKDDNSNFLWQSGSTLNQFRFRDDAASGGSDFTNASSTTDANYVMVYDQAGDGLIHLYKDGSQIGTGIAKPSAGSLSIDTLGNGYTSTTYALVGTLTYCYVWSGRALNSTEVSSLHSDPYQFFVAPGKSPPVFRRPTRFFQRKR